LVTNVAKKLPPETLRKAIDLEAQLWTHARIAEFLGVARETVTRHLSRHRQRLYEKLAARAAAARARQVAQLEYLADEAAQSWRATKRPALLGEARNLLGEVRKVLGLRDPDPETGGWPAAGSDEVTAALEELQRIEDKRRGEQPQTPADTRQDDDDGDDQDDDQDRGRRGQGGGQDKGGGGRLGVRPPEWF
jgi:hypothetical protein